MPISGSTPRPLKIPRMSVARAAEDKGHRVNNGKKATELFPKDEAVQDDEHRVPDGMCAKIDAHDATAFVRRALCVTAAQEPLCDRLRMFLGVVVIFNFGAEL
jgi:hypothetical protein